MKSVKKVSMCKKKCQNLLFVINYITDSYSQKVSKFYTFDTFLKKNIFHFYFFKISKSVKSVKILHFLHVTCYKSAFYKKLILTLFFTLLHFFYTLWS